MKKNTLSIFLCVFSLAIRAGQEIKLTLVEENLIFEYSSNSGDWYFGAYDETGMYTVHLDYFADRASKYGTYTNANLDSEYSYVRHTTHDKEFEDYLIGEGSTFTVADEGQYFTVNGKLLCNDGNTYCIEGRFMQHEPEIIDIECQFITMMEYYDEDKDWYVRFKNDDYKVTLDLLSSDGIFSGTYTEKDATREGACFITDLRKDEDIPFVTFSVTMTQSREVEDPRKGCEIIGLATAEDGNIYRFHMLKNPPVKPVREVSVDTELTLAEWPTCTLGEGCYYELTEKQNPVHKWQLHSFRHMGRATTEELDTDATMRTDAASGEVIRLDNGEIIQTVDTTAMSIVVNAKLVMSDSVQYNISFANPITVNQRCSYTYTDLWVDTSLAEYGTISLNASNDKSSMYLSLYDYATVPGSYDDNNAMVSITATDTEGQETLINSIAIICAQCTLNENDSPVLECSFIGDDMNIHDIKASFVLPEITDTLTLQITNASFYDSTKYNAGFSLEYCSENYDSICCVAVNSADQIVGHYTVADLGDTSHILITDGNGNSSTLRFHNGEFDVTTEENNVILCGAFQAGRYHVLLAMTNGSTLPSSISELEADSRRDSTMVRYNIMGQRISSCSRGICIMNGRKVMVK